MQYIRESKEDGSEVVVTEERVKEVLSNNYNDVESAMKLFDDGQVLDTTFAVYRRID